MSVIDLQLVRETKIAEIEAYNQHWDRRDGIAAALYKLAVRLARKGFTAREIIVEMRFEADNIEKCGIEAAGLPRP